MPKIYKFRELKQLLKEFEIYEVHGRGKGSERIFRKDNKIFTLPCHGDNRDVLPCYIRGLEERFGISIPR